MTAFPPPSSNSPRAATLSGAAGLGTMANSTSSSIASSNENVGGLPRAGVQLGIPHAPCKHFKPENLISLVQALNNQSPEVIAHCIRVAALCSRWAAHRNWGPEQIELIEGLAILHDLSFGLGSENEDGSANLSLECIDACGGSIELQQAFALYHHWLASSAEERTSMRTTEAVRMLVLADVYDSLTCGDVLGESYTPKKTVQELHRSAGGAFDRALLQDFALFVLTHENSAIDPTPDYWLELLIALISELSPDQKLQPILGQDVEHVDDEEIFHRRLLDYMHQGVVMVDLDMRIFEWNRAAERLTGLMQIKTLDEIWRPGLIGLTDEDGKVIAPERCPLADSIVKGMQSLRRLKLKHRDGREMVIDAHFLPVKNHREQLCGATFMFADASQQAHLEKRVQTLHEKATRDGLTMVANRAELDRQMLEFVNSSSSTGMKGCLIITDIDRFKKVNDIYGHQAGDEALKLFAEVLRENARESDIVARYGGEEFVVLCRDCSLQDALKQAERMRMVLQSRPLACLKGTSLTASFGVTEVLPSDTCEVVIQRADEALFRAKESGRNRVLYTAVDGKPKTVQVSQPTRKETASWLSWFSGQKEEPIISQEWLTSVPLNVVIEKMRGVVMDFQAEVLVVEESRVQFRVENQAIAELRRRSDRRQLFIVDVKLAEVDFQIGRGSSPSKRTMLKLEILPNGRRDRRVTNHKEQVEILARTLQSYLVAQVVDDNLRQHIRGGF
ncbi:MAG: diguanylate cyclase [Planctomycetaceae bacterium]|nr:diguanylate cyclase [Planctomycetaceae bacterium]